MEYQPRISVLHRSLLEQKTMAGVDKEIAIFNGTLATAIIFATRSPLYIPFAIFIHVVMRWLQKQDPFIRKVYLRYNILGQVYDPWPRVRMSTNERPDGFSKGLLC